MDNGKHNDKIVILALNKPKGVICSHKDEFNRTKIYDLIPKKSKKNINGRLHSVGRLDYNSQGLILLTNNSKIKRKLELPSNKVVRVYKVKIQGIINDKILKKIKKGILVNKVLYKIKSINIIKKNPSYSWVLIKLDEGKNQHIRKIFMKIGLSVNKLIRIQYGPIRLASLKTGDIKFIKPYKLKLELI